MLLRITMKVIVVLVVVTLANARPEAGYNYGAPPRPISFGNGGFISTNSGSGSILGGVISGEPFDGVATQGGSAFGNNGYNDGQTATVGGFSGGHGIASSVFPPVPSLNSFPDTSFGNGIATGASFGTGITSGDSFDSSISSDGFGFRQQSAQPLQQTVIQKHIYVHVPPPEPEEVHFSRQIAAGIPQKHYKIIFIKAPSPPTPSAAAYAAAVNSQEKTIVYVLVKKPDEIGDFSLPSIAPTQPSKPEVYFIRYKTQKDHGDINIGATGTGNGNVILGTSIISDSSRGAGDGSTAVSSGSATNSVSSNLGLSIGANGIESSIGSGVGGGIPATSYGLPNQHHGGTRPY